MRIVFSLLISLIYAILIAQDDTISQNIIVIKKDTIAHDLSSQSWIQPIKWKLNKNGDRFIKFGGYIEILATAWQNNPHTTIGAPFGQSTPKPYDYNIGLRRVRLSFNATLSPRWSSLICFGVNNFWATHFSNNFPSNQILDALIHFKAYNWLQFSFGLSQDAFSRVSGYSPTGSIFDDKGVAMPDVNITDDLLRQWGIFIHGNIKRFNYRTSFTKPFLVTGTTNVVPIIKFDNNAHFAYNPSSIEMKGYFTYNFWDIDPSDIQGIALKTNHLGRKKILTIGTGIMYRSKGSATGTSIDSSLIYNNILHFSADFFLDLPFNKYQNDVLTIYSLYLNYNFGKNYLKTGSLYSYSPTYTDNHIQSASLYTGNTEPILGTGHIWQTQIAYLFPKKWWFKNAGQIQLGTFYTLLNLQALNSLIHKFDAILNFYFTSNLKFSLVYSTRPIFGGVSTHDNYKKQDGNKGQLIFQTQVKF
ncbi:MAG: hypothetical protein ACRC0A_05250 [Chitinophagaceae bacterium]